MGDYQWQHCHCKKVSCNSCQAERVALEDHTDVFQDMGKPSTSAELPVDFLLNAFSGMYSNNRPLVRFDGPPGSSAENIFICWFNESVSDSTYNGRTEFSYASPLIVYWFAHKFMLNPSHIKWKNLPKRVIKQVYNAIEKGNTRYSELYPAAQRELTVEETLKAWPGIDMEVVSRYASINQTAMQHIMQAIQQLQPNQVLLIVRETPYKVVSIACTADPGYICLFDSQMHTGQVPTEGAMLFYSAKDITHITMMLLMYQTFCFFFEGKCEIVILQKKT